MAFTREINRLMLGLLLAFFLVLGASTYWAIVGADSILLREDNPRLVENEAAIRRGSIYDRNNTLLAESIVSESGRVERHYYHPEAYSVLGYFSWRYGVAGAESAYDAILRGDSDSSDFSSYFEQDILHIPQEGTAIQLSLDLAVQGALVDAIGNRRAAAVVVSVPEGEVLALVSLPSYDPNSLDENWEALIAAEGNPFFNRVLQGQYQPGGMLQTPLMTAGILSQQPFDIVTADANRLLLVDDILLSCAVPPPKSDLSYSEAYAYACPRPFALLAEQMNPNVLENIISDFRLDTPPSLGGFIVEVPPVATELTPEASSESSMLEDVLGQGTLTINPLGMAGLAAAIINEGNSPQPYALQAIQAEDGSWQSIPSDLASTPIMTNNAASRVRDLMLANTELGASLSAARTGYTIGGHTALAISGETTNAWFIGFVQLENGHGAAIAIVLENTSDANLAATIGGIALETAANSLLSNAK